MHELGALNRHEGDLSEARDARVSDEAEQMRKAAQKSLEIAMTEDQEKAVASYEINIDPAPLETALSTEEIVNRFETDHTVRRAPRLREQTQDESRQNEIVYLKNKTSTVGTSTSDPGYDRKRSIITEQQGLIELEQFFERAQRFAQQNGLESYENTAVGMMENLTYIGEKEYKEATAGIAEYWKALLERNPKQQILILASEISKRSSNKIKSDQYMLERVLENFSDAEIAKYQGRLVTDVHAITANDADDLKVVMLDDWTISGSQMSGAAYDFKQNYPEFSSSIEIQLIAASPKRITEGMKVALPYSQSSARTIVPIPVRAYFTAHKDDLADSSGVRITGSHSSVDFDFENEIDGMLHRFIEESPSGKWKGRLRFLFRDSGLEFVEMPPLTNVVRPYRTKGFKLTQAARLAHQQMKAKV